MRAIPLLLTAVLPFGSGCSAHIAGMGQDVIGLTTREQVREQFGSPIARGTAESKDYEDFRTRRKIAEELRAYGCSLASGMTFGAMELVLFPAELATAAGRIVGGQTLRFWFDQNGEVIAVYLDESPLKPLPIARSPANESGNASP